MSRQSKTPNDVVNAMFAADARKDIAAVLAVLHPEVHFRFGSAPPIRGHAAVRALIEPLFAQVASIEHRLRHIWVDGARIAVAAEVTFARNDGRNVTLPYVNTLVLDEAAVATEYLIHIDPSPLFQSP